jgi:hypothetical protein
VYGRDESIMTPFDMRDRDYVPVGNGGSRNFSCTELLNRYT